MWYTEAQWEAFVKEYSKENIRTASFLGNLGFNAIVRVIQMAHPQVNYPCLKAEASGYCCNPSFLTVQRQF